jgi:SAM-dependent methyltransferase
MPNPPRASNYIHGASPAEQRRLSLMNDLLNEASLRELGLGGGEKVLDVGSGLGQFSRAMARAGGSGAFVLGIERSVEQLGVARRLASADGSESLLEFREGDAFDLPLRDTEWGCFDVAHARFLLEHVTDPLGVVSAMVRAVRPGGRIVLVDDDHDILRLWPEPPGFMPLWHAYTRSYDRLGNDPFVGRRLVSLLSLAGARPVRATWIFFGGCAGQAVFPGFVENMIGILVGARDAILATAGLEARAFDQGMASFKEWKERPDAAMWYAISWAEGARHENPHGR